MTVTLKQPWVPFPAYLAGGIGGQPGYIVAPAMIANPKGSEHPIGTGPFKFKQWVPNDHFTASAQPRLLAHGAPLPRLDHLPAHHRRRSSGPTPSRPATSTSCTPTCPRASCSSSDNSSYGYLDDTAAHRGRARHELHHVQPVGPRHERHQGAPGHGHGHQLPSSTPQVVDKGVNTPCNQPFVAGHAVLRRRQPGTRPTTRARPRRSSSRSRPRPGKPVAFALQSTTSAYSIKAAAVPPEPAPGRGHEGHADPDPAGRPDQRRPGGLVPGHVVAPVRGGGPRPQLPVVEPDRDLRPGHRRSPRTSPATPTRRSRPSSSRDGPSTDPATRAAAYQRVAQRLNVDLPYIWNDRATWAIVANSKVQNWNNPTTPEGAKAYGMIVGTIWTPQIWKSNLIATGGPPARRRATDRRDRRR